MSTNYHTAIVTGASNAVATVNNPLSSLDTQITVNKNQSSGGAAVTAQRLKDWAEAGAYEMTSITYHSTYTSTIATATVKWPDGSAGTFTATSTNATYEAIDAYTITHTSSSQTVTQAAVTRDSNGNITAKPALTVA